MLLILLLKPPLIHFLHLLSSFYQVFNDTKGSEKLVVAALASQLKKYWIDNTPCHVSKQDIIEKSSDYFELFNVGDNVKKVISELQL